MISRFYIALVLCTFGKASAALGADEHPDALYQQGRFEEAEKAYAEEDMDHPKDIRFRYNRGCAAYQNGDFEGAAASFTSVLKRADNNEARFKATFNLGNAAFKKGDLSSAAHYFKQALMLKPDHEDSRVNLELTLRELEKNKGSQKEQPGDESTNDTSQKNDGGGDSDEKNKDDPARQNQEKQDASEQETKTSADQREQQREKPEEQDKTSAPAEGDDPEDQRQSPEPGQQDTAQEPDRDLSGSLEPMTALPQQQEEDANAQTGRELDRRKADAFLNNVKEDPSRFLQYQLGKQEGGGAASGKDW